MASIASDLPKTDQTKKRVVRKTGVVSGPGGPKGDRIPALLSSGEYVVPANVVKAIGKSNLDALLKRHGNAARPSITRSVPAFAEGGAVGDLSVRPKALALEPDPARVVYRDFDEIRSAPAESPPVRAPSIRTLSPEASAYEAARGPVAQGGGTPPPPVGSPTTRAAAPAGYRVGKAAGALTRGVATGIREGFVAPTVAESSLESLATPTSEYRRRLGMDPNAEGSVMGDLGVRTIGTLSDAGASLLDLGTSAVNAVVGPGTVMPFKDMLEGRREPPDVLPRRTPVEPKSNAIGSKARTGNVPAEYALEIEGNKIARDIPSSPMAIASPAQARINQALIGQGLSENEIANATPAPQGRTVNNEWVDPTIKAGTYRIGGNAGENSYVRYGADGSKKIFVAGDPVAADREYAEREAERKASIQRSQAAADQRRLIETALPEAQAPSYNVDLSGVSRGRSARIGASLAMSSEHEATARRAQNVEFARTIVGLEPQMVNAQSAARRVAAESPLYGAQAEFQNAHAVEALARAGSITADEARKRQFLDLQGQLATEEDPKKAAVLEKRIASFNGKIAERYQPLMRKDELGNTVFLGSFDQRTGQIVYPETTGAKVAPPAAAIEYLKANPKAAKDFDAKYGAGAAARVLGGNP